MLQPRPGNYGGSCTRSNHRSAGSSTGSCPRRRSRFGRTSEG